MLFFDLKDKEQTLEKHFLDLKKHLIFSLVGFVIFFVINFYFSTKWVCFFQLPLIKVLTKYNLLYNPFIVTTLPEGFLTYVKVTFYVSILTYMPILLWQVIIYILPIINNSLRKELLWIVGIFAPGLFYIGVLVAYFATFHVIWQFLVHFIISKNLGLYLKISDFITLALNILLCVGLSFELPIILYTLYRFRIIHYQQLIKIRKYVILLSFIVAAIFTPPDPFSQIIMAIILILLYELSLMIIKKSYDKGK